MLGVILGLLAAALFFLYWWLKAGSRSRSRSERLARRSSNYRSVMICCGEKACDAVKSVSDKRYLCALAPLLPLPECDVTPCHCRYQHFDDRRDEDRREVYRSLPQPYVGRDRRINRNDRRSRSAA